MRDRRPAFRFVLVRLVAWALTGGALAALHAAPAVDGVTPETVSTLAATSIAVAGSGFDADARLAFGFGGPVRVGSIETGGEVGRILRDGDRLLVAAGAAGLLAIDVADPTRPGAPESLWSGPALDVALAGGTLWVATGDDGIVALPRAGGASVAARGVVDVPTDRVYAVGGRVYSARGNRMTALDASDPASPVVGGAVTVSSSPDPLRIRDMLQVDGRLYLAVTRFNRPNPGVPPRTGILGVVDVDSLAAPVLLNMRQLVPDALALARRRDRLYVAGGDAGLALVDVSTVDNPLPVPLAVPVGRVEGVTLDGATIVAATAGSGLQVHDLDDAGTPALRGQRETAEPTADPQNPGAVVVVGPVAYAAAGSRIDMFADLGARTPDGFLGTRPLGGTHRVALRDGVVFATNPFFGSVVIDGALISYDVSDPSRPTLLDGIFVNGLTGAWDIALGDDHAYVAAANAVAVVSVADPTALEVVRSLPFAGFAQGVDVDGALLAVAGGGAGLVVYDLADPADPVELGSVALPGFSGPIDLVGDVAYISGGAEGLHVVDLHDPAAPVVLATLQLPAGAGDVAVWGGHAFVGSGTDGVFIVDVSQPDVPVLVGTLDVPRVDGVEVVDGRLLAGGFFPATASEFDVRRPRSPIPTVRYQMSHGARGFAIVDGLAAVADGGVSMVQLVPFPADVMPVTDDGLRATAPAGLPEGDYDVVVVSPDGSAGRGPNALAACAAADLDASLVRRPRGWTVTASGDPSWFRPEVRHDAALLLPEIPDEVLVQLVPGSPADATLRIDGSPPRATLAGSDETALHDLWDAIVARGGMPLPREDARTYGPFGLEVSRVGAPLGGDGIRPLAPIAAGGVAVEARLRDGRLVSARIKGRAAVAAIEVAGLPRGRCAPRVVLHWPDTVTGAGDGRQVRGGFGASR